MYGESLPEREGCDLKENRQTGSLNLFYDDRFTQDGQCCEAGIQALGFSHRALSQQQRDGAGGDPEKENGF